MSANEINVKVNLVYVILYVQFVGRGLRSLYQKEKSSERL